MEPIFEAVLVNDPSRITAAAAAQRMEEDLFVAELHHMLYRGDTPLHLAAAGLRYDAAGALLAAGAPVNAVNRRGATSLHYAWDPRPLSPTWDPGATMADVDRNGVAVADRIQSQALRDALAAGQLLSPGLANVSRVRHDVADHRVRLAAFGV